MFCIILLNTYQNINDVDELFLYDEIIKLICKSYYINTK